MYDSLVPDPDQIARLLISLLRCNEQLGLHVEPAELSHTPSELQICLYSLQDPHVSEANLSNELQLGVLRKRGDRLRHLEHTADDVVG